MPVTSKPKDQTRRATLWTLGVVLVLLIYGSLYPWRFHYRPPFGVIVALTRTLPIPLSRLLTKDVILNVFVYMPVGILAYFAFYRSVITAAMLGTMLSIVIETAQYFDSSRVTSTMDICSNALGSLVGAWLSARLLVHWKWPIAPAFLLACFAAWQILALTALKRGPSPTVMPFEWLAAIWICWGLTGRKMPQSVSWIAAVAFTVVLVWAELAPFKLVPEETPFSWIPFAAFFLGDPGSGFLTLLNKLFLYGTAVWLWTAATGKRAASGMAVAGLLFVLERAQMHLPPKIPEATDSILALAMTFTVLALEN